MINVIIVDDHKIVVDGMVSILDHESDIKVVGTAADGSEAIELIKSNKVDIAVVDIEMPIMNGVDFASYLKDNFPGVKILILSMYKDQVFVEQILKLGAKGYILKNKGGDELVKAIKYIYDGQSYIGQEITDVLIDALKLKTQKVNKPIIRLTKREREVLALIIQGLTSIEIGKRLFIQSSTVDTHRRNLIDKSGVANSKALISFAIKNKLLDSEE